MGKKLKIKTSGKTKITPLRIATYFCLALLVVSVWIVLFQFTKIMWTEDTTLWGVIPWSDSYFMFVLLFIVSPTTLLMILYLILKKSGK